MPLATVFGASGGIGRAIAQALGERGAYNRVIGVSRRRPADWPDDAERPFIEADITDEASLSNAAVRIASLGDVTRVIVATGLLHGDGVAPEKSMRALDPGVLQLLFKVNTIGPALVAKHILPLLPQDRPSLFAALSARVGSIGDNRLGGWYGYRASKAALNMMIATLAIEHRRTHPLSVCVALHPGTVDTALSQPFQQGATDRTRLTPTAAAAALLGMMDRLGPADSGRFFAWNGEPIVW